MGYLDKPELRDATVGSILHGAYGDYYEQLLCLLDWKQQGGCKQLRLFFANPHRKAEFDLLDLTPWASCYDIEQLGKVQVDQFVQFQIHDQELNQECLNQLPQALRNQFDFTHNLLPHLYFRDVAKQRGLSSLSFPQWNQQGEQRYQEIQQQSQLSSEIFADKTLGLMWRYRSPGGAIKPLFQQAQTELVEKYSQLAEYAIQQLGCQVIVAGMRVKTTDENRFRVDAKFPEFGLNFEHPKLHYLKGLGWLSEIALLGRCDYILCNPSGFSEALFLQGKNCELVDPPLHYVLKTLKNRFPLFDIGVDSAARLSNSFRAVWGRSSQSYLQQQLAQQLGGGQDGN